MIHILHIGLVGAPGGIESCVLNYDQRIDHTKFSFDFADIYGESIVSEKSMKNRIEALGGKIYSLTDCRRNLLRFSNDMAALLRKTSYDIIHIHMISAARIILPLICCSTSRATVIVHCHNASVPSGFLRGTMHFINKYFLRLMPVEKWSCGIKAGKWMWGKHFNQDNVIYNAIEYDRFKPDEKTRSDIREKCGYKNEIVVGFVGHFCEQKNVLFLPEILAGLIKLDKRYRLLIIGDGAYRGQLEKRIQEYGLSNFVYLAGMQPDAAIWYQAMDVFVLPSLFEGLPTVGVEAQANGLPCIVSNTITREIDITQQVHYLPIDQGGEIWAEAIHKLYRKKSSHANFPKEYNITYAAKNLENKYIQLSERKKK